MTVLLAGLVLTVTSSLAARADTLDVEVGGFRAELVEGKLDVKEIGGFGPNQGRVLRSDAHKPTRAQLATFWKSVDDLGCWSWTAGYSSPETARMDGVRWSLELGHGGRHVRSEGYNAFPDRWSDFVAAIRCLAGPPGPKSGCKN